MEKITLLTVLLLALSSLSGLAISARLPWSEVARSVHLDRAVGLAVAPFLAGLATVLVLWLMPGQSHGLHLAVVMAMVAVAAPWGWSLLSRPASLALPKSLGERLATLLLYLFGLAILFDLTYVPLIQNDALEYATVGRILFEARDLAAYPAITPAATPSGFFAPWTHPPLYVALIYLFDLIQGQADSATILRLVAPWFLLVGAYCMRTLGRIHSPAAGVVAAVIFISTPLLFLGATSALIDPLPVVGMVISFAVLVGSSGSPLRRGAALGLMLGLALWTHSQAILFPCLLVPLLLLSSPATAGQRARQWLDAVKAGLVALLIAVLIGGAPYVRNMLIFGSPISDNPEVFAYAPLGFADYFRMQRGISSAVEIIQYGVLKGFFSIEAYSLAFWLSLLGFPLAWRALRRQLALSRSGTSSDVDLLLSSALCVFGIYTGATALSSALGIDLMIKNERYLLVVIPCVALLAGAGLAARPGDTKAGVVTRLRMVVLVLLLAFMPAQLVALVSYRQSQLRGDMVAWDEGRQLARWPHFEVVRYLRDETPPDAVVLSMKPADMFYSNRRMISYLDPRLLSFYAEGSDNDAAWRALRDLNISFVHMTDYMLPPVYMSRLMSMVTNQRYAQLVSDSEGYQIYALKHALAEAESPQLMTLSVPADWRRQTQLVLGGRKSRARILFSEEAYRLGETSVNDGFSGLFHRESGRVMISPKLDLSKAAAVCQQRRPELVVVIEAEGVAQMQVLASSEDASGATLERRVLGDRPVLKAGGTLLERRMPLDSHASTLTLQVEHRGASHMRLTDVRVALSCPD